MDVILQSDRVGWPMFGLRTKDFPAQDLNIATTTEDGTFAIKFEKPHAGMERLPIFSGQARCTLPNQPEDVSNLMQTSPEFVTTILDRVHRCYKNAFARFEYFIRVRGGVRDLPPDRPESSSALCSSNNDWKWRIQGDDQWHKLSVPAKERTYRPLFSAD